MNKRTAVLASIALLASLAAAEVVGRAFFGVHRPPLYQTDPEIEYMLQPNQASVVQRKPFLTNQYGMRSPAIAPTKAEGARRILFFGDSLLAANMVGQDDIATTILAKTLTARGAPAEVGNISAHSWGPGNWLAYAKRYGFFQADTVVLLISSHDYADNPTFGSLPPYHYPKQYPTSALAFSVKKKAYQWAEGLGLVDPPGPPPLSKHQIARGLADLRTFLALAGQDGRKVIVFQHFERTELDGKTMPGADRIATLCRDIGVELHSLLHVERARKGDVYADHIHFNAAGQRMLADEVAKRI